MDRTVHVRPVRRDEAAAICAFLTTVSEQSIAFRFFGAPVRVPAYEFPEDAARAVALAAKYGRWRARSEDEQTPPAVGRTDEAAAIISAALARGAGWLSPSEVADLLAGYALPLVPTRVVPDVEGAVAAAAELGAPVALKARPRSTRPWAGRVTGSTASSSRPWRRRASS